MPLLLRLLELPLAREKLRQVFFRKHSQQKKSRQSARRRAIILKAFLDPSFQDESMTARIQKENAPHSSNFI